MLRSFICLALIACFLVLLHQDGVEAGRGQVKRAGSTKVGAKAGKAGKAGKGSAPKDSSPFGKIIDMLCGTPLSPMNGGFSCQSNARQMKCNGKCASGFQFPDGSATMQLVCTPDGVWTPANKFPDCEAVCNPPCQNGGTCMGNNKCLCDRKFWGSTCEIPVSICDITQVQSVVGYHCNRTNDVMTCTVNCPDGMEFESKPASQYTCGPYTTWQPPNIPGCQASNMIVHSIQYSSMSLKETVSSSRVGKNGMCATWDQKHFQTFDGSVYSVEGKCTYLLAKDCNADSFAIHLKIDKTCTGAEPCNPVIQMYMDNERYELKRNAGSPSLYKDDQDMKIPYAGNFFVEKVSHYILVTSSLGFTLIWDGQDDIQIEVTKAMQNNTCGLCGNNDGFSQNDLKMADGSVTTDLLSFVNSWKMNAIGDVCHDPAYLHETCISNSLERESTGMCQRILDPEYAACVHLVDPAPYIQACKNEFCACSNQKSDCGCHSVEAYFRECARLSGPLATTWRKADFCPATCPQGMTFKDCGTTCPPTCKNPERECAEERCLDGCFCAEGTVRHGEECIPAESCPCTFIGQEYKSRDTIQQDCNTCMCFGGHWQCTKEKCESRCSSVGDPHYTTFDGKRYDFMGKCAYYLVAHTNFTIEQETVGCDGSLSKDLDFGMYIQDTSSQPSCTKWVTIRTHGTELQMKQNKALLLNGKEVSTLPTTAPGLYVYMASSTFIKAQLSNGIVVSWDGQSRVYIDAPPSMMGETLGLCGTFTLSQRDDFLTREGDIEHNVNAFANKWKTEELCHDMSVDNAAKDPCTIYTQRRAQAEELCGVLQSPLFHHCHDFVDTASFYHNCMYDMCSCQNQVEECLCPTISDYAAACTKIGVPINWRDSVEQCHVTCPSGQVYQTCSSSCRRSCFDIANNPNCHEQCVEGCNCPQGFTLDVEGHCIPVSQCMCLYDNFLYEPGETDIRERQLCECENARWNCRAATQEELLAKLKEDPKPSLCSDNDNMEPTDCELVCPPTCANMHNPPQCPTTTCKPGCRCKSGYVLETHSKKCVRPSHCPCHHGGRNYGEGETMQQDCNTCMCTGGQWKCEKKSCPGTCTAWGDSHFKTFDNQAFEFLGDCEYTMAHGRISENDFFTVNIQNKACGTGHVACFKAVTIIIEGEKLTLTNEQPLPRFEETNLFIVREVGLFVVVHTDIGLTILWDKGTRVYIRLDTRWQDKVEGLCGNFNDNELDDFRTPLGGPVVVRPAAFADSWKTHDQCSQALPVQDTCQLHAERQSWAQKRCSVLKSEIFSSCHAEVPFEPYLDRCVADACACDLGGDCECLCTAIAAYAQECNIHGIPILWRSQDLCPIQCRTCDEYTSCMSVCPKKTCETEFLYAELEESCKQEMCVEGCEPPSCPVDEIFTDDQEFKCIPRSECVRQPCKVINGKMYHEGERVSDPEVADACQSCHCKNGDLSCVGEACPPSTLTPKPPTSPPPPVVVPQCLTNGWTEWVNSYVPTYKNGGDYERLSELITGPYHLCPLDNIVAIECRTTGTLQNFQSTGQYLRCNLPEGLICENADQQTENKLCHDYEIRVFCSCEQVETVSLSTTMIPEYTLPTPPPVRCTAPGWTLWMNSASPTSKGEIESIASMRKKYTFCGASEIEDVECREVSSRTKYSPEAFPELECTKQRGAVCRHGKGKDKKCTDFEVRFFCSCTKSDCDYPRGMEIGAIRDDQITVSSSLSPNTEGKFARLHGSAAWSPKEIKPSEWIQIDLEELQEVTGIRTQGSPENAEWVSAYKLMYSADGAEWITMTTKGNNELLIGNVDGNTLRENLFKPIEARLIRIAPIEWVNWISLRLEILGCNRLVPVVTPIAPPPVRISTVAEEMTTVLPTPFPAVCNTTGWSEWMNVDSPFSDEEFEIQNGKLGDNELLSEIRYSYSFCEEPSSILCRVAGTNQFAHTTGQLVDCDPSRGLECVNAEQSNGACLNYEVSVYCECEEPAPPTPSTTTTTPEKKPPAITCKTGTAGYTQWMNAVDPSGHAEGDMETYSALRSQFEFCEQKYISSMQCRLAGERTPYDQANQYGVVCDINHGLLCLHSMQPDSQCKDYEVRFYCLCLDDIVPTPTIPPEVVKPFTAATYPRAETTEPPKEVCDEWTRWYDYDNPSDMVEEERWSVIDNFNSICPHPIGFQCVAKETSQSYDLLDLRLTENCNSEGIVCHSDANQNCPDFQIRAFCACEPPKPIPPVIPPEEGECDQWTDWFNIDHPASDGGDFERIEDLQQHYGFCRTEMIEDIQCEIADAPQLGLEISDVDYQGFVEGPLSEDKQVKCHRYTGLECYNSLQEPGKMCHDYRVRFFCRCEKTKATEGVITTTPPPAVVQTCNGWTEWVDFDTPYDGYEEELFSVLPNFNKICPVISEVECVEANSELPYTHFEDVPLQESCTHRGIICAGAGDDQCPDFKIRAYCECEGVTTTVATTTALPCDEGWTEWFDNDNPADGGGDFETMADLRNKHKFCTTDQITEIECKTKSPGSASWVDHSETGDTGVKCSKYVGLACYNNMQAKGKQCSDYSIRFHCSCGVSTTPVAVVPTTTPPCQPGYEWDNCAYRCDQMCHSFLKLSISRGECKNVESQQCVPGCRKTKCDAPRLWRDEWTCVPETECTCVTKDGRIMPAGDVDQTDPCERCQCLHNNLICLTDSGCRTTPTPYPHVTESTVATTTQGPCQPGFEWDNCAYRCDRMCHSFLKLSISRGECKDVESHQCIPGCRKIKCDAPHMWKDEWTCVPEIECTCVTKDGKIMPAGEVDQTDPCERCQCLNNNLICLADSGCKTTPTPYPQVTESTPVTAKATTTVPVRVNIEQENCWTSWVNVDSPSTGFGDYESIAAIRAQYEFCSQPVKIECREVTAQVSFDVVGQPGIKCDLFSGLVCQNQLNGKDGCYDYEVRFYCPCELSTTTPRTSTTPVRPVFPVIECVDGFTEWFNSRKPNEAGEYESVAEIRNQGHVFCDNEEITLIECRDKTSGVYDTSLRSTVCNLQEGFHCRNSNQAKGKSCPDYEVRFLCECFVTMTSGTTPVYTLPPRPTIASTTTVAVVGTTEVLPPCAHWSPWINDDNSISGTGDEEPMTAEQLSMKSGFCKEGEVSEIECVDTVSGKPYYETGDHGVTCSIHEGLVCRNEYQESGICRDYKIRYYCSCASTTAPSTTAAPTTTPLPVTSTIFIVPSTSPPVRPCNEFVNLVEHLPDSNIKATSSLSPKLGPQSVRLNSKVTSTTGGSWTAGDVNKKQYLQIDLGSVQPVYGIITQGHAVNQEWVKSYRVQYSRDGSAYSFVNKKDDGSIKTFTGNYDNVKPSRNMFDPAFEARFIRIQPRTWERQISMRLELLGCAEMVTVASTTPYRPKPTEGLIPALECVEPMGLQNMNLADQQITASSSRDEFHGPSRVRLGTTESSTGSGGWLPKQSNKKQYLQIDFIEPKTLTGLVTQGRDGYDQWVTSYEVQFSNDGKVWNPVVDENNKVQTFAANVDNESPVTNDFVPSIRARYLRILPKTWHNWIGLRLEVKGCYEPYPEITTPEGVKPIMVTEPIHVYECLDEMGIENGQISDDMIKVSSSKNGPLSDGSRIRLNTPEEVKSGGWVAETLNDEQFVEIDLRETSKLTGITVQGRDKSDEWVTKLLVLYSTDGITWTNATNTAAETVFTGNHDSSSTEISMFEHTIEARYVLIVPLEWHNWISMRLELIGCYKPYPTVPVIITTPLPVTTIKEIVCDEPMGLENGFVSNPQITVSSTLAGIHSGGPQSRLNTKETASTGGWVAQVRNRKQYIQIDFLKPVNLTGIITQGRDKYREWVKTYTVTYSTDGNTWQDAYSEDHEKVFSGNEDEQTPVKHHFDKMLSARFVRVNPVSWNNWISMRLEIVGCYTGPETTPAIITTPLPGTTQTPFVTPPSERTTVAETCMEYGPWLNLGAPSVANEGDREGIEDLIAESHMCKHPIVIQCRDYITHEDYGTTEQKVVCDLEKGLICKHTEQKTKHCYDYEARIGCYTCPANATLPPIPPVILCPEVPLELAKNCPVSCPRGKACDGAKCVSSHDCACYVEGKKFNPGDKIDRSDCHECTCQLQGHSHCVPKVCSPCETGFKNVLARNCSCTCERCPDGQTMCPSSGECVPEEQWCDGIVDCPDDEKDCVIATTPSTTPSCPDVPVPACSPGTTLVLKDSNAPCPEYICEVSPTTTAPPPPPPPVKAICDLTSNYFKTFDGLEYPYEICHHLLIQDKEKKNFNVTIHKKCSEDSKCSKYLVINQDSHRIRLGGGQIVEYNSREYTAKQLVKLGQTFKDFSLRIVGNSVIFTSKKYDFQVEWDINSNVRIEVDSRLLFKINGLCGFYSSDPSDDMQKPSGAHASAVEEFGNSWATDSLEHCKPQVCPPLMMKEAMDACNELRETPFKKCNAALPPDYHVQVCLASVCECMINSNLTKHECACQAYLPYVEACQKLSPPVEVEEWRFKKGCVPKCPPGLEWHDCGPGCERTCDNLYEDLEKCQEQSCVSGCFCPPGLVKKGERCLEKESCQDCVCKGYGDPHYYTFDKLYYPFQGNCTYILSRDRSPTGDHKFEVYATNQDCKEEPDTTCTVEIYVLYDGHIAHFKVNESVAFDGIQLYPSDFPFEAFGYNITITSPPGRTVTIRVDAVHLEVRYFELNYGFEVRIPSEVYYNKTEGLCANCDYDKSDDMLHRDGYLTNDTDDFAFSWLASAPEGMKNPDVNCVVKPEVPCQSSVQKARCQKLLDEEFANCHLLVDPEPYVKACEFDTCHSVNPEASLCRSLTIYARECAQVGICIHDWRTEDFCPAPCPNGMHFDQCGPACMHTCNNKDRYKRVAEECQLDTVEGCFCSGNRILRDGVCVDPISCETCDLEDHKVGDTWQPNPCTSCTCNTEVKVQCTESLCPPRPVCPAKEWLQTIPADNSSCCETHLCIPKPPPTCPEEPIPSCPPGEIANPLPDENNCTKYTCACDVTKCPPVQEPVTLAEGEEVVLNKSGCCPVKLVVCKPENCPERSPCSAPMVETKFDIHRCCPQYDCKPPPDSCAYEHEFDVDKEGIAHWVPDAENRKVKLYKPGESWMDGFCATCRCTGSRRGHYKAACQGFMCPEPPSTDDYHIEVIGVPRQCCPKYKRVFCREGDKNYTIGQQWHPHAFDVCKKMQCISTESGDAEKMEVLQSCQTQCKPNEKYIKPPPSVCCGHCKAVACIGQDNKVHEVGDEWRIGETCWQEKCIEDPKEGVRDFLSDIKCPPLPENCPEDKIEASEDGCCEICSVVPAPELCYARQVNLTDTIRLFDKLHKGQLCTNKEPVHNFTECFGKCESHSSFSSSKQDFVASCHCCVPLATKKRTVMLECEDETSIPLEFKQPTSCMCSPCSNNEVIKNDLQLPGARQR